MTVVETLRQGLCNTLFAWGKFAGHLFSLRSCRSLSVIFFFDFSRGNLGNLVGNLAGILWDFQESPQQTKPKKGPKRKVHEFRPCLWILVFFVRKTCTIHIELLFRNALAKSSWTDLSLVWLAGATPEIFLSGPQNRRLKNFGGNFGAFFVRKVVARKNLSRKIRSADVPP